MRKIMVLFFVLMSVVMLQAQGLNSETDKQITKERLDKNTEMAYVYQNGALIEKGKLVNGKRDGVWQSFNANGTLTAEASFANGVKDGMWIIYDQANLKYVLYYENDVRVKVSDLAAK